MAAKKSTKNKKDKAPRIDPEEVERLRRIAEYEDDLEEDIQSEIQEVMASRDRKTARHLKKLESKNKKMAMWTGVSVVMLSIVVIWVMNIDIVVQSPLTESSNSSTLEELREARENLDQKFEEVVEEIESLQKRSEEAKQDIEKPVDENIQNNEEQLIR